MRINEFEAAVCNAIQKNALVVPNETIIVAVSGGADSMALLCFFLKYQKALNVCVEAAHVNHGMREQADADEAFVRMFCEENGVRLHVWKEPRQTVPRSEDWARQVRYGFFEKLAKTNESLKIATAHTLTDQAETLLFRLARGTGMKGAAGIPVKRGIYIRPLLTLAREDTERYCHENKIEFVTDETNQQEHYARNRIRHRVLPQLEQINPKAQQALGEYCARVQVWQQYFEREGANLLREAVCKEGWNASVLAKADPVLRTEALRQLVEEKQALCQNDLPKLERLVAGECRAVQLAGSLRLERSGGILHWAEKSEMPQDFPPQPALPGEYDLPGGYRLKLQLIKAEEYEQIKNFAQSEKKGLTNWLDYDKINSSLSLRTRQPGDQFRLKGRNGSKTLKKLFNEKGIPTWQRALLPLLAEGSRVVWLWGEGVAEGFQPTGATCRVLQIQLSKHSVKEF